MSGGSPFQSLLRPRMHPRERLCIEPFPCEVGELLGEEEQFALEVALKGPGAGRVALVAGAFKLGRNVLLTPAQTLGRVKEVQLQRPHRKNPAGWRGKRFRSVPDATDSDAIWRVAGKPADTRVQREQAAGPSAQTIWGGRPPEPVSALIVEAPIAVAPEATGQSREAAGVRATP